MSEGYKAICYVVQRSFCVPLVELDWASAKRAVSRWQTTGKHSEFGLSMDAVDFCSFICAYLRPSCDRSTSDRVTGAVAPTDGGRCGG